MAPQQDVQKAGAEIIESQHLEDNVKKNGNEGVSTPVNEIEEVAQFINSMELQLKQTKEPKVWFRAPFKTPKQWTRALIFFASMGGMLSGLDQSIISGANLFLPIDLGLTVRQNSLVNSAMPLGAVGGAIILSPANEFLGRKGAIILACILYTIGAVLQTGAMNFGMIVTGRAVMGMGVGLEGGTVPIYVAETVERKRRGNMVSLYQLNIAFGEVIGYSIGAMFVRVDGNWRYILGSSLIFSTIMFIGMLFLPESPRYLMHKRRPVESYRIWRCLRGTDSFEYNWEFMAMKSSVDAEEEEIRSKAVNKNLPFLDFFTEPRARRSIVYANIMVFLGQFTGCNAILYYLSTLLNQIGFDKYEANYMSLVGGGALLFGTIPAVMYMERFGRRVWAIATLPGFFIGLILLGLSYLFDPVTQPQLSEGLYLSGLILYYAFFGSYACLTWVIPSEVYPTYLRSYGMTTSDATLFLSAFIMTYNFSAMQQAMTGTGLMIGFYGGIAIIGWFYQILFIPETKGLTLEEIDAVFQKPTHVLVKENVASSIKTARLLLSFRFSEAIGGALLEKSFVATHGHDDKTAAGHT